MWYMWYMVHALYYMACAIWYMLQGIWCMYICIHVYGTWDIVYTDKHPTTSDFWHPPCIVWSVGPIDPMRILR